MKIKFKKGTVFFCEGCYGSLARPIMVDVTDEDVDVIMGVLTEVCDDTCKDGCSVCSCNSDTD